MYLGIGRLIKYVGRKSGKNNHPLKMICSIFFFENTSLFKLKLNGKRGGIFKPYGELKLTQKFDCKIRLGRPFRTKEIPQQLQFPSEFRAIKIAEVDTIIYRPIITQFYF